MKRAILDALEAQYQADIAHADATLKIYFESAVGIGEHLNMLKSVINL